MGKKLKGQQIKRGWNKEDGGGGGVVGSRVRPQGGRRWWRRMEQREGNYIKEGEEEMGGPCPLGMVESHQHAWKCERVIHYHLLRLAEVDVFHVLPPWLAFLDIHDADERHGSAPEEEDGEEHDDDGGGADQLPLLDGLQAQMEAQGVGNGTAQTCQGTGGKRGNQAKWVQETSLACWGGDGVRSPLNHMMNIILGVILWSLKKFSRKDRGNMFTARPRRTRTCRQRQRRDQGRLGFQHWAWVFKKRGSSYDAPDDKRDFKLVREAENGEAQESKHARLWKTRTEEQHYWCCMKENLLGQRRRLLTAHEGDCAQRLLHEDLGDGRKVVMGVVRHDDSCKQDGHYSCLWERERERESNQWQMSKSARSDRFIIFVRSVTSGFHLHPPDSLMPSARP